MKTNIGDDILVEGVNSNGSNIHAAKITRVWSDADITDLEKIVLVNAIVFQDMGSPLPHGSVRIFASRTDALSTREAGADPMAGPTFAYYHDTAAE